MNHHPIEPRYEFRVFGQDFGRMINVLLASSPLKRRDPFTKITLPLVEHPAEPHDEGLQTYLLATGGQSCSIKVRNHQLDTKVLLRQHQGLERWQPHLRLAFPLTAAFLHEFLFAWLEIEPPHLWRAQYTEAQFLQELIIPNPSLHAVQVRKQRRCFTLNECAMEMTALTVNDRYHTYTVAVEATDAEKVLDTVTLLGLQTSANTNYLVGLSELLGLHVPDTEPEAQAESAWLPIRDRTPRPELVFAR